MTGEPVWLVVTDEDRLFELSTDEVSAKRAAKAIDGFTIKLEIADDYRKRPR